MSTFSQAVQDLSLSLTITFPSFFSFQLHFFHFFLFSSLFLGPQISDIYILRNTKKNGGPLRNKVSAHIISACIITARLIKIQYLQNPLYNKLAKASILGW